MERSFKKNETNIRESSTHDAIKRYALDAAYAIFDDDARGSIKPGKLADMTISDINLMKIDPNDVLKMNIEMTIVEGEVVCTTPTF